MPNNNTTKCECNRTELDKCGDITKDCCLYCDCDIHNYKNCKRDCRVEKKKEGLTINLQYFNISEFDQPGLPGSGQKYMDLNLLILIDKMRHHSGIPYKITSAYRSQEYNDKLAKSSKNSAHIKGKAVDISAPTSKQKYLIIKSALNFGIERIGVGSNFIHIDIQEENEKPTKVIWTY